MKKIQIKISGDTHSSCNVLLNTLKGTKITLPAVILYYSTLSGANRQILTPKRYDEHPRHSYRETPSRYGSPIISRHACHCICLLTTPSLQMTYLNFFYLTNLFILCTSSLRTRSSRVVCVTQSREFKSICSHQLLIFVVFN